MRIRSRRKPLPLFSTLTTSIRPICAVEATWVPPSACVSSPTMSTMRTSLTLGRHQVGRGPDDVGDREGLVARQHPHVDTPVGGDLRVAGLLDRVLEALWHLRQVEVHPRLERLHVAAGHQRAEVAEDDAAQQVQPGVRAHQRGPALVLERAADGGARRRERVALGGDQVQVVALARADDAGLYAAPEQHAVVRRLAAAAGVEGGPVEDDPVLAARRARSRPTRAGSGRPARADACARPSQSSGITHVRELNGRAGLAGCRTGRRRPVPAPDLAGVVQPQLPGTVGSLAR